MKIFSAKTVDEAIELASKDLCINKEDLIYTIEEEKNSLFVKKAVIQVTEFSDVVEYTEEYLKLIIKSVGISEIELNTTLEDDIIRINIETNHNPILIGKNGVTLQAINEIVRLVVSSKFKRRYRILLDIAGYKSFKYSKVASIARRVAKEVQKTKVDASLDPMSSDERRMVHNALSNFSNIKTESTGEGRKRAVVIKYSA